MEPLRTLTVVQRDKGGAAQTTTPSTVPRLFRRHLVDSDRLPGFRGPWWAANRL